MRRPPGPAFSGSPFASLDAGDRLRTRHTILDALRAFFKERGFIEVETPIRVPSPGIDPHIDALPAGGDRYLATSPEQEMKKLLLTKLERIFQVTRAFRAEETGDLHYPEFAILEWYAAGETYIDLMESTETLVRRAGDRLLAAGIGCRLPGWPEPFRRRRVDEIFMEEAGWRPSRQFDEERFFYDLVHQVEPALATDGAVFLTDYPAPVGALARKNPEAPELCERFELYLDGIEICNGFTELTDRREQEERFIRDNRRRVEMGKEPYPVDRSFLDALESGLPPCAGNALGVDRLILALTGSERLGEVSLLADPPLAP